MLTGTMQCRKPLSVYGKTLSLENKAFCFSFIVSNSGGFGGVWGVRWGQTRFCFPLERSRPIPRLTQRPSTLCQK